MARFTHRSGLSDLGSMEDLVEGVARVASRTPRRIAFRAGDHGTTYGQLRAAIDGMRLVTRGQGMTDSAAVAAAVLHCAPEIASSDDPAWQAQQLGEVMEHLLRDPAARDGHSPRRQVATDAGELDFRAVGARVENRPTA